MQSSSIPASAPPPVNAIAPAVVSDTAPASTAESEDFSAVLARGLTAKAIEPKPDGAPASMAESADFSDLLALGLAAEAIEPKPDAASASAADSEEFSAVLALGLAVKVIEPKPDIASAGAADSASEPQPPRNEMVSLQIPADPVPVTFALLAPRPDIQPLQPGHGSRDPHQIRGTALTGAAATEALAPHNLPQAAFPDRAVWESDNQASFAAPGKFLPPFAAPENTPRSGTEKPMTQPLPDSASAPQMSYAPSAAAARLATGAAASQNLKLEIRVGAPGWSGELAQTVAWMATRQQQVAELHLNPPHLGPVEVVLTIGKEPGAQANVQFASPHSAAREALEAALPRLREMLADSGIALGNATVSADSFQQRAEAGRQDHALMERPVDRAEIDTGLAGRPTASLIRIGGNGLVDTFA